MLPVTSVLVTDVAILHITTLVMRLDLLCDSLASRNITSFTLFTFTYPIYLSTRSVISNAGLYLEKEWFHSVKNTISIISINAIDLRYFKAHTVLPQLSEHLWAEGDRGVF